MLGNIGEIAIRGQQEKAMFDAGCSDQAIDRTGLDAVDSTPLPQLCRSDRGRLDEEERAETVPRCVGGDRSLVCFAIHRGVLGEHCQSKTRRLPR